jgi:hypothetical protein
MTEIQPTSGAPQPSGEELVQFSRLTQRLPMIWRGIQERQPWDHTSVVVPSLSFDQEELAKISGAPFYEERLLFILIRLRDPRARVAYVTSQPIHPDIVDYYLQHLVGVPAAHARARLGMFCVHDASARPLTEKLLERPRTLGRLRRWIGDPRHAYLTCFNTSFRERRLAVELGIPLNGADPALLGLGTKSGSREVFREAGVELPRGYENLHDLEEILDALDRLSREPNPPRRVVVKLNDSFAGTGNALFTYPEGLPEAEGPRREALGQALTTMRWTSAEHTYASFLRKMGEMGGVVEEFVEAQEVRSPSVQLRINPDGEIGLISTHDQVLGGNTGQTYLGCRFPADGQYRALIQERGMRIAEVLRRHGVISRFGIDFLLTRPPGGAPGDWQCWAIEINLRMGGTTPPFLALQFLAGGECDPDTGLFISHRKEEKFYYATDNLASPRYRGLLPEDLMDILALHGLQFEHATETGVLFHMIGALSQYGKVGVTCIGNSRVEADELYQRTVEILDLETGPDAHLTPQSPSLPGGVAGME